MSNFEFVTIALLIGVIWNQSKIKRTIDYLYQDHIELSRRLFPEDFDKDK